MANTQTKKEQKKAAKKAAKKAGTNVISGTTPFEKITIQKVNGLEEAVTGLLQGLNRAESTLNKTWNTMNVFIRVFQKHLEEVDGITKERFTEIFKVTGAEVFAEAKVRMEKHIDAMQAAEAAKTEGKPIPEVPNPELDEMDEATHTIQDLMDRAKVVEAADKLPEQGQDPEPTSWTINGALVSTFTQLPYDEVVALAVLKGNPSITVRESNGTGFILSPGQTLTPSAGMIVNAVHTGNA